MEKNIVRGFIRRYFRYDTIASWSANFLLPTGSYRILSRSPVDFQSDEFLAYGITDQVIVMTKTNSCRLRLSSAIPSLEYAVIMDLPLNDNRMPALVGFRSYNVTAVAWAAAATTAVISASQWQEVDAPIGAVSGSPLVLLIDEITAIRSSGATIPAIVLRNRIIDFTFRDSAATSFHNIRNPITVNPVAVANNSLFIQLSAPLIIPANSSILLTGNSDVVNADNAFVSIAGRYLT